MRPLTMPPILNAEPPSPDTGSAKVPPRRRLIILIPWICTGLVLAGMVGAIIIVREPTEPLNVENLQNARHRWSEAAVADYDLVVEMSAAGWQSSLRMEVLVRGGRLRELRGPGASMVAEPRLYTVEGLFETLERELELSRDIQNSMRPTSLRVRFDPRWGFPVLYLRVMGASQRSSTLRVREFRPVGAP